VIAGSSTGSKFNTLSLLTAIQRLPTPFLSAFMLVHLSAPLIANIGGSSASSQVMLLGREYYQGQYTEPLLVFAPLGIHVTSSLARRILLSIKPSDSSNSLRSKSIFTKFWHKLRSMRLVTLSAYPTLAFVVSHLQTHRLRPSMLASPIFALSPSELDYEFVKYGLKTYPLWAWATYGCLVFATLYHAGEGAVIVIRAWTTRTKEGDGPASSWGLSTVGRRRAAAVAGLSILTGLFVLWSEPLEASTRMMARYAAVYNQ